ncbi:Hsp70 family protein [Glycomyces sp. NPDC048151]|uniref:Hsp70 family protein n=1 Tax=Glycomyces sp. NPDC048151 TaxID=3364002 RepID=UPI003713E944
MRVPLTPTTALGIDFGTSHTVAVVRSGDGRTRPLLFGGTPLLPSAVFATESGEVLTGQAALQRGRWRPERLEANPKRHVDAETVLLGDGEFAVTALIAAVLGTVLAEAELVAGKPERVTLTVPADWGPARRLVLQEAAELAGLSGARLVPEPVAAATFYSETLRHRLGPGAAIVVYDLGAGTCDVSAVRRTATGLETVAVDGRNDLGGLDLDAALIEYFGGVYGQRDGWERLTRPQSIEERRALREFQQEIRTAKEHLSRHQQADFTVPLLEIEAHLTRGELDRVAAPILERTVRLTKAVIKAAGVADTPAEVFLVGGASRMPLVANLLHRALGVPPTAIEQPETAVAEGSVLWEEPEAPETTPAQGYSPAPPYSTVSPPVTSPHEATPPAPSHPPIVALGTAADPAPAGFLGPTPPADFDQGSARAAALDPTPPAAPGPVAASAFPVSPPSGPEPEGPEREPTPPNPEAGSDGPVDAEAAESLPPRRRRLKEEGLALIFIVLLVLAAVAYTIYSGFDSRLLSGSDQPASDDGLLSASWASAEAGTVVGDIPQAHSSPVVAVAQGVNAESDTLFSADESGTVKQWSTETGDLLGTFSFSPPVLEFTTFLHAETEVLVALDADYRVHVWNESEGEFKAQKASSLPIESIEDAAIGVVGTEPALVTMTADSYQVISFVSGAALAQGDFGDVRWSRLVRSSTAGVSFALLTSDNRLSDGFFDSSGITFDASSIAWDIGQVVGFEALNAGSGEVIALAHTDNGGVQLFGLGDFATPPNATVAVPDLVDYECAPDTVMLRQETAALACFGNPSAGDLLLVPVTGDEEPVSVRNPDAPRTAVSVGALAVGGRTMLAVGDKAGGLAFVSLGS